MARTHNLGVAIDSMASNPSAHISALPSSSTAPSDLSGFDCNIGPSHSYPFYTKKQQVHHHGREPESGCDIASIQFPPSPPPTNSDPKRNVPLPRLSASADPGPSSPFSPSRTHFEAFLDPPVLMKHVALGLHTPLTPPPTLPTPTLALPPADTVLSPIPNHDELEIEEASLIGLPSSSQSRLPDEDSHALLYPLSPEWIPTEMTYERSPPSPSSPPSPPPFTCDGNLLYGDHRTLGVSGMFDGHGVVGSPDSQSQLQSRPILPLLDTSKLNSFSPKSTWSESPTSSAIDLDMDTDTDTDMDTDMDIMDMDMDVDYDDELELELDLLHTPTSLPTSPFLHNKNKLDLDVDPEAEDVMFGAAAFRDPYQHPSAPSIHQISFPPPHPLPPPPPHIQPSAFLPSLDFDLDLDLELELNNTTPSSPSSPSLRSFSSLPSLSPCEDPEFHYDNDDDADEAEDLPLLKLTSPPSPAPTLLALPGADTDDDLLPPDLAPSPFPFLPSGSTTPNPNPGPGCSPGVGSSNGLGFGSSAGATTADPTPTPHTPYSPLGPPSLLLVDDSTAAAVAAGSGSPRSPPSPSASSDELESDAADLEMALMMMGGCVYLDLDLEPGLDVDVRRLGEIWRRCVEAERKARAVEVALSEPGHGLGYGHVHGQGQGQGQGQVVQRRWEARRVRKRERERGREVGAMLRLKLGERRKEKEKGNVENQNGDDRHGLGLDVKPTTSDAEEDEMQRKRRRGSLPSIRSMNQLVAKMLLRRNDTSRSLANRKTPFPLNGGRFHVTSPLVRHAPLVGSDDDVGPDDDDDDVDDGGGGDGGDGDGEESIGGSDARDSTFSPGWEMESGGIEIAGLPPPFACVSLDAL